MRIQKSVYFYEQVSPLELDILVASLEALIDEKSDDIRIYRIKNKGISLGKAIDLHNPLIFK